MPGSKEEGLGAPEIWDDQAKMESNIALVAKMMKESKHCVFYTGAGISTAAGIPDFRGPNGVWTNKAKGIKIPRRMEKIVLPTFCHMAIKKLMELGYIKFLISQNVDGLHLTSGIPDDKIAELHGNTHMERCKLCKKKIMRDFYVRVGTAGKHDTFRDCPKCGGKRCLYDSIIDFGDNLPEDALEAAELHSKKSDCSIVLGTSLRVSPACSFPIKCKKIDPNNKLVIVNAQETPYDKRADIVAHSKTDAFMRGVCQILGVQVDDFIYQKALELIFKMKKPAIPSKKDEELKKENFTIESIQLKSSIPGGSVTTDVKDCTFNFVNTTKNEEKEKIVQKWKDDIELEAQTKIRSFEKKDLKLKVKSATGENNFFVTVDEEKNSETWKYLKVYLSFGFKATVGKQNNEIEFKIPLKDLRNKISNSKASYIFDFKTNIVTGEQELCFLTDP